MSFSRALGYIVFEGPYMKSCKGSEGSQIFSLFPVSLFTNWCLGQAHQALKWDERLAKLSGEEGVVVQQDKVGHFFCKARRQRKWRVLSFQLRC